MKKTDIQTANPERLSKKEYTKALRRAKRTKRAAAKAKAKEVAAAIPKTYDILVHFDKRNHKVVTATLEAENIKPVLVTEIYAWIRNATCEVKEKVCEAMSRCTVKYNGKDYKVRVSAMRSKEEILKEAKEKKPTNNTAEVRAEARKRRKSANIARHERAKFFAEQRKTRKKNGIVGRKEKLYTTDENGNIVRITHNRGSQCKNLLEKKLLQRAKKAGQYLLKQENKKAKSVAIKAITKHSKKVSKPVQTELPLAA